MEAPPDSSDDDSSPLSPSAARAIDGDAANADLEAGVRPAPGDARTGPPRQNRYALIAAAALTAVAIVVIENLNHVHGADDYWTRRYDGLVLWGLAGLEERPERNVVLPEELTALLAPGPRGLARVDDGRAGLHLLVLPIGED